MKVFLGGTVNGSTWREYIKPRLKIKYFDPVVTEWNEDAYQRELLERKTCDYCLYVLTPKMEGYYSISEVIDDSYKRPDRTIFCYLPIDEGNTFDESEQESIEKLGKLIISNGGTWLHTLDQIIDFLNSAISREKILFQEGTFFNNVFISYGRKHSLGFVRRLHDRMKAKGYGIWFDMNDIPLGVDFQEQIDEGIEKADNFIFVISPHSVKSEYCLKEIVLALKYNKRIIPILHVEPTDCWDKIHPVIAKLNWIYIREKEDFALPHEKWQQIDNFDDKFQDLIKLIESQKEFIRLHSILLHKALQWEKNQMFPKFLLTGKERLEAQNWLNTNRFFDAQNKPVQAPTFPTDSQCEYITESKKYADNQYTEVFISYSVANKIQQQNIVKSLSRYGITTWLHSRDIAKGVDFNEALKKGIEQASNMLYMISNESVKSEYCNLELDLAIKLNKRIIPILIEPVESSTIPAIIKNLQYIDFTDNKAAETLAQLQTLDREERIEKDIEIRKQKSDYDKDIDEIVNQINFEKNYYEVHKQILTQAITWERRNFINSILLRGLNCENGQAWLKIAEQRSTHLPTDLQVRFIQESINKSAELTSEVYLSYDIEDIDFTSKLNEELKIQGKITWFADKNIGLESQDKFKSQQRSNIESAENFIFILSPNFAKSPECVLEYEYAKSKGKRIIGIFLQDIDLLQSSLDFKKNHLIDFRSPETSFQSAFSELIKELDFDKDHIQNLNKWLQKAMEWESKQKDKALLLRGNELVIAKQWLRDTIQSQKKPHATAVHKEFIGISNKEAIQYRIRLLVSTSLMIVVSSLAIFAFWQKNIAIKLQEEAEITKESLRLMSLSTSYLDAESGIAFALAQRAYELDSNEITKNVFRIYSDYILNKVIAKHKDKVRLSCFSPDGKYILTGSYDNTASLWDLSGNLLLTLTGHTEDVRYVAFSPDQNYMATAGYDEKAIIWNMKGEKVAELLHNCKRVYSVSFSPDSKTIITGAEDNNVYKFDLTGKLISTFSGHKGKVYSACFSPDGSKILSASSDRTLILWTSQGKKITTFTGHNSYVSCGNFSPDGKSIVSGSGDNTTCIWNLEGQRLLTINGIQEETMIAKGTKEKEAVLDARFSNDGQRIIVCYQFATEPYIYDTKGDFIMSLKGHLKPLFNAEYSKDGNYIVTSSQDQTARLWSIVGRNYIVYSQNSMLSSGYFSNSGKTILLAAEKRMRLVDIATKTYKEYNDSSVISAVLSKDDQFFLTASVDGTAKLWSVADSILSIFQHDTVVSAVVFSPGDSLVLTGSWDGKAYLWRKDGTKLVEFIGHKGPISAVEFSPNGKTILTGSWDGTVKLWDLTGKNFSTISENSSPINSVTFSPDGKYIASANDDNTAKLWLLNGTKVRNFEGHTDEVWAIYFSPDGKYLLTGSKDRTAKLWTINGEIIQTFIGHKKDVLDVDFSPDGTQILTVSEDKTAIVWKMHPTLNVFLKNDIWYNLSKEQINHFLSNQKDREKDMILHKKN